MRLQFRDLGHGYRVSAGALLDDIDSSGKNAHVIHALSACRPGLMSEVDQYDYELPAHLIAQHPLHQRTDARLLVVDRGRQSLEHFHIRDLPELLGPHDCLVLNDTRVVPARLVGRREKTGGRWTGLFLRHAEGDLWQILGKTRGKLQVGERLILQDRSRQDRFALTLLSRQAGGTWVARPDKPGSAWELLEEVGRVPLPPYIRGGEMEQRDLQEYQTVFAQQPGAVAAPTAGLHFTEQLLDRIRERGVHITRVTLHVGLGTFRPIAVERLDDHAMHEEWAQLSEAAASEIRQRKQAGGRLLAVGTTVVRTLETAARHGDLKPYQGTTDLFIRPPYEFRAIDGLLTNFHLPRSTLLILVRTFGGDALMRRAYQEAIDLEYRFYSYGDAMLIV